VTDGADVDGACVGLIDGNFVGNIDGTGDGTKDGKCVGEGVGNIDGTGDGTDDGNCVGEGVGRDVGTDDGVDDGLPESYVSSSYVSSEWRRRLASVTHVCARRCSAKLPNLCQSAPPLVARPIRGSASPRSSTTSAYLPARRPAW
jgi:hypothetical protein